MISRIKGELVSVAESRVELGDGGIVYEVLVPPYVENALRLRRGEEVTLFVHYYMEGGAGGATMTPRLVGFLSHEEKAFYNEMVKVPGLGARTALRTMVDPPARMARAIESGDRVALSGLPGVGKRTAEKIIASLKGKMAPFLSAEEPMPPVAGQEMGDEAEEALMVLMQLGYKRVEAERLVEKAVRKSPDLDNAETIVQAVLRDAGAGAVR